MEDIKVVGTMDNRHTEDKLLCYYCAISGWGGINENHTELLTKRYN